MDKQNAAVSMFMCRLCNLFSPSHTRLLAHCSQLHPQQQPPDDIIIALQPLVGEPGETLAATPVKRKRGRPKGSKKKTCTDLKEDKADSTHSPEDNGQRGEEGNKEEDNRQCSSIGGENHGEVLGLECRVCHRSFSNRRQIVKHICLGQEEKEDDEEENGNVRGCAQGDPEEADPNQAQRNSERLGFASERDHSRRRPQRTNQRRVPKEGSLATEIKKTVISVVLTEDETLPGVSKMVPVEDISAETDCATIHAEAQSQSKDSTSDAAACEGKPETDQQSSSKPACTTTATAASRGFQEYSIKQDAPNLLQSQLKIFACEFCNKIFKFRHSLVAHLRTHTQEKPFQCPHCEYASAIKANLNVHLRKHTGEKFNCQHCSFNCLSPGHLKVHIERVHLKVKQHCSFCEKKYSDVKNLLKHMEIRHNLKDPAVHRSYRELRLKTRQGLRQLLYHCLTCNRRFKNQLERERHLLVHGPQRPFACLLCDHAATRMDALAVHVRKHLFLYVCCVCEGKFVSSQRLTGHLKELHAELDQDQAFTDCINNSFYLMQPAEGIWGNGDREDAGEMMKENRIGQDGEDERGREEVTRNGGGGEEWQGGEGEQMEVVASKDMGEQEKSHGGSAEKVDVIKRATEREEELEKEGAQLISQEVVHQTISLETQENTVPADENTRLPSAPQMEEGQTPQSERLKESQVLGVYDRSAFEQIFSSLQKSRLNMESFKRLRKIYGDLECQYCGKLFWYKVHYNVHVRTHTKEHSHYCSKCSYSSITKSSLKRHQIQKHSGLLLPCSNAGCNYTTPDKYKLQAHLRMHQEQGSVTCPVCQQNYPEHRLKYHMKTSHPDTLPMQGKGIMVKRAEKCPYCDSYFLKNSSDFQRHIWAHQGLKPYVCSMCDYAGRSRSNLKTHMNRHNTERCHLCDLCGKKFKSKVTLKSHRLSHTDEGKQFQCSECDFTSVSKPSLLRHMEQHAEFKVGEAVEAQYVPLEDEEQLTEASVAALRDNVNIQQITEFSSENYDAVTSMVAMAPGTVTVVQQLQVADEQEVGSCGNQLMVVNEEGGLAGSQVMVVGEAHGLEALTVLSQGDNTHHYIVYVQEHTVEIN